MRVHGEGPSPSEILVCGEGPGYAEDRDGRPFRGPTGRELDTYLNGVDLPERGDIFLTNIYRQYGGKDYVWTAEDLARDEPELLAELRRVRPSLIITLGRHATRYFLGDVNMDETEAIAWTMPTQDKLAFLGDTVVFPVTHPAAGLWNSEMSPYVVRGFQALAQYLRGELAPRVLFDDPYETPAYSLLTGVDVCHVLSAIDFPSSGASGAKSVKRKRVGSG